MSKLTFEDIERIAEEVEKTEIRALMRKLDPDFISKIEEQEMQDMFEMNMGFGYWCNE